MSTTFLVPTNEMLRPPIQNYVQKMDDLLGLSLLPFADSFAQAIKTEERDSDDGMTAPHVLGTDPVIDERPGHKVFRYEPLHFKETDVLGESEILNARELGTYNQPISLDTEVTRIAQRRARKTMTRVEWTIWQALGGRLQFNENNVKVDETFDVEEHNINTGWDVANSSTPLTDLDVAGDKFDGTGASMEGAIVVACRQTWRLVMANQNDADLKALDKTNWGNFRFMFSELAKIIQDKCGAVIKSYDEGYKMDGTFTKYVPYGEVRIIGKRSDGAPVGNWWRTPSLHITKNNKPQPGYFVLVEANGQPSNGSISVDLGQHKNPKIEITGGIYGGPNIDFEDNVIKMSVLD